MARPILTGAVASIASALLLAGCPTTPSSIPTSILLTVTSISFDAVGANQSVTASVLDQRGQSMATTVAWSSNSASVTVQSSGNTATLTAAGNGSATITVSSGVIQVTINVQVAQVPVAPIKLSGDLQTGPVGAVLGVPLQVRVVDRLGMPIPNQSVSFAVTQGGGMIVGSPSVTGTDGIAASLWTLGTSAGQSQEANAMLSNGLSTTFIATAQTGPPAQLVINTGQGQTATVGTPVPIRPSVVVRDGFGNPVGGLAVSFAVSGGNGTVSGADAITDAAGLATVGSWMLGTVAGPNTLSASVSGLPSLAFNATAQAGPPAALSIQAGQGQTAPAGSPVPVAPSVRVNDQFGNPVSGVSVGFSVTGGGGSITGGAPVTTAAGIATVGSWILGAASGTNTLTATVQGLPTVTFTATAAATGGGLPATVIANSGTAPFATAGSAPSVLPSVLVRDAAGQGVSGVPVTFAMTRGTGVLTGANAVTGANGVAAPGSWTLGPGVNCLTATVAGSGVSGNPVSFIATGIAPVGAGYEITVQYLTCVTAAQEAAFTNAVSRWGAAITGDVLDLLVASIPQGSCGSNAPAIQNRSIDDLLIFATIEPIDGPGAVLGSAGPCFIRNPGNLPVIGRMRFDIADIDALEANGRLTEVILHEMGHVIGIGTMWGTFGFLQMPSPVGGPAQDTNMNGANAIQGFNNIGGDTYTGGSKVPVENMFSSGTINAHWREGVLANELMTGFINVGSVNALSELTIRSLADFGYVVNPAAADPFHLTLALRQEGPPEVLLQLVGDVMAGPIYRIDSLGRLIRVR